jgi:hypothetical protein
MLFRLDNPRFIMNSQEFPANVVFYCLAYQDCTGDLIVNYTDPGSSRRVTEPITPTRSLPIFAGMTLHEYVVPFLELHDNLGRRGATVGFNFVARSSFRVAGANYGTRTLDTTMIFPVIGGGIIRIQAGGQEWDIANPTFDPNAQIPGMNTTYGTGGSADYISGPQGIENRRVPDDIMINAYQRTHRGYVGDTSEIERRRAARLANFDLREVSALEQQQEAQTPPPQAESRITLSAAELRRQEREVQIQEAETSRVGSLSPTPAIGGHSRIIGARLTEEREVSLIMPATKAPKAPPKTRLERISEDTEED